MFVTRPVSSELGTPHPATGWIVVAIVGAAVVSGALSTVATVGADCWLVAAEVVGFVVGPSVVAVCDVLVWVLLVEFFDCCSEVGLTDMVCYSVCCGFMISHIHSPCY